MGNDPSHRYEAPGSLHCRGKAPSYVAVKLARGAAMDNAFRLSEGRTRALSAVAGCLSIGRLDCLEL